VVDQLQLGSAFRSPAERHPLAEKDRDDRDLDRVDQSEPEQAAEQLTTTEEPDVLARLLFQLGDRPSRNVSNRANIPEKSISGSITIQSLSPFGPEM
jgi:hypothetical protein